MGQISNFRLCLVCIVITCVFTTSCFNESLNDTSDIPNEHFYVILDSSEVMNLEAFRQDDFTRCGIKCFVPLEVYRQHYNSDVGFDVAFVKFGFAYDRQEPGYDYHIISLSQPQLDSLSAILNDLNKTNFYVCDEALFIHQSELEGMITLNRIGSDLYMKMSYPLDTLPR